MVLRTDDLALATTLRLDQIDPQRMEVRDGKAFWVFEGHAALAIQKAYEAGQCRVEPRAYNLELRRVREQLFMFLRANGIHPQQRRR